MSLNKVMLIGRLGRDPEVRYTPSGAAVCTFSLATDESFTDSGGEKQKRTEWHSVVAWKKLAELAKQYLAKGREVYIEGRLQTREWDDKEGNKRKTTEIVATNMTFIGGRPEKQESGNEGPIDGSDLPF